MKGFKKLFKQDKASKQKKILRSFINLLSKQAIRVLQAFKEKQNKAQASSESFINF